MYVSYRRRIYCCTLLSRWSISESRISKNERESRAVDLETIKPDIIAGLIVAINMRVVDTFYLTSQTHSFIHFERIFFYPRVIFQTNFVYSFSNARVHFKCKRFFLMWERLFFTLKRVLFFKRKLKNIFTRADSI